MHRLGCSLRLGVLLLGGILSGSAHDGDPGKAAPDDAKTVDPGHSMHGQAFNEGPRQHARPMAGMPEIRFDITTTNAVSRKFFLQGVGQLHGFWYLEAERSFRESAFHDTNCAMAYWGMAMANANNTARAAVFIQEADRRKGPVTRRERLWIESLAEFHKDPKRDEKERRRDYTRALENLIFEFPDDVEAKAFLAVHLWDSGYKGWPIGSAQAVESILKEIFAQQPMHPAHHYRIHLWDGEKDESAIRAVPSASKSGQSSPGVAHQWHMAGHTFNKLKRYADMAWQQEASVRVDNSQLMADRLLPDQIHNYAHNSEWLVQTYNYLGQARKAVDLSANMIEMPRHPGFNTLDKQTNGIAYDKRGTGSHGRRRLMETLLRWELWDETLRLSQTPYLEPTALAEEQGRRARLLGLAHLGKGDRVAVSGQIEAIEAAVGALRDERRAHVDAAEAKAKADKKGRGEIDAAIADAVKRTTEPMENLENFIEELRVGLEVHAVETNDLPKRLEALKTVSKERLAGLWFQVGDRDKALKLAKEAVDGGAQQVHPLAVLTELQWKAGKTNEALATFATLRGLAAWMDTDLPLVKRLAPVIAASGALGSAKDWRPTPTYPADSGTRPALDTLGSFHWKPQPAPPLAITGSDGKPVRLADYHGRPVLLVFYLGGGCLHCVEQLRLLAPRTEEFKKAGIDILAISTETVEGLAKTREKAGKDGRISFPLAADPTLSAFKQWHAHDDFEGTALHGVFLIDGEGRVRWQDIGFEPFTDFHFLLPEARRLLSFQQE
jgi:peroxiredoxin